MRAYRLITCDSRSFPGCHLVVCFRALARLVWCKDLHAQPRHSSAYCSREEHCNMMICMYDLPGIWAANRGVRASCGRVSKHAPRGLCFSTGSIW